MAAKVQFSGPKRYRIQSTRVVLRATARAAVRRARRGPLLPTWNWAVEIGTAVLKAQLATAFGMADVKEARQFLDAVFVRSPALDQVSVTPVEEQGIRGHWYQPHDAAPGVTLLYAHGGGYSFYPKAYANLLAHITLAAQSRTFALDYRLSPEHRFPAQLEDAMKAYRWLLDRGTDPHDLVVGGDSAGANLALGLLQSIRAAGLPQPALAVLLSPPTEFDDTRSTLTENEPYDWVDRRMLVHWASWFCDAAENCNPLLAARHADLQGLAPIYMQAGRAEILFGGIQEFAQEAQRKGADVVLEAWDDMNHDFQLFGYDAPQSVAALRRLGEVIRARATAPAQTTTTT